MPETIEATRERCTKSIKVPRSFYNKLNAYRREKKFDYTYQIVAHVANIATALDEGRLCAASGIDVKFVKPTIGKRKRGTRERCTETLLIPESVYAKVKKHKRERGLDLMVDALADAIQASMTVDRGLIAPAQQH